MIAVKTQSFARKAEAQKVLEEGLE